MTTKTHFAAGLLVSSLAYTVGTISDPIDVVVLSTMGAIFPDIDARRSTASRLFWIFFSFVFFYSLSSYYKILATVLLLVSFIILNRRGHRQFTHSILGWLYFTGLLLFILGFLPKYFMLTYGTHLLLDSFTKGRIKLFYPSPKRYGLGFTVTGSRFDYVLGILCLAAFIANLFSIIGLY